MLYRLNEKEMTSLILSWIKFYFGDLPSRNWGGGLEPAVTTAYEQCNNCFAASGNKRYYSANEVYFNNYHSGQMSIFLYFLSKCCAAREEDTELAEEVYYLNRIMNGVDWYYGINLPNVFGVEHPVGSVLGRAEYGENFFIHQGCTVGANLGKLPKIGRNVCMCSNSQIFGESIIGNNVIISAGTHVFNKIIKDNCVVYPDLSIREYDEELILKKISIITDFRKEILEEQQ